MNRQVAIVLGSVAVLGVIFGAAAYYFQQSKTEESKAHVNQHQERLVRSHSPSLGPSDAPVTLVEFLDPECEACASFYPIVKRVLDEHPGKVRLVIRFVNFHKNSEEVSKTLAVMKARGKFWEALEMFFERQSEWADHNNPKPELLKTYVEELGVSKQQLATALSDPMYASMVQQDVEDGKVLNVVQTPTFYVNGEVVAPLSVSNLRSAIQGAIASAGRNVSGD